MSSCLSICDAGFRLGALVSCVAAQYPDESSESKSESLAGFWVMVQSMTLQAILRARFQSTFTISLYLPLNGHQEVTPQRP